MNTFLNEMKYFNAYTTTENGAGALKTTGKAMLDAFGSMGAMKESPEKDILKIFVKAFNEDREMAMRLLFYMRDVRGGQGMRRVFRVCVKWLGDTHPEYVLHNLDNFLFFGRGDDIFALVDTAAWRDTVTWLQIHMIEDLEKSKNGQEVSLMAKWMPSENTSSQETRKLARRLQKDMALSPKTYRKLLSFLRGEIKLVESQMSQNEWDKIKFENVPSRASMKYSNAFEKHLQDRYYDYLKEVSEGKAKINAGALFPVDIVHKILEMRYGNIKTKDRFLYNGMWNNLPNYFEGKEETGLCVVDVSGSMWGTPMEVALSLGLYCAGKARGPFKNHFITFSGSPSLQEIGGEDIIDDTLQMERADWGFNTNLEKVFDLIVKTAISHKVKPEDVPNKLYIISDMQFDVATNERGLGYTWLEVMKRKYQKYGYEMPALVFWNVRASDCGMFQETYEGLNVAMVSGYSPSLFKAVIEGTQYEETERGELRQKIDPIEVMNTALMNERYDRVWTGESNESFEEENSLGGR